jgi:hypothetical protein
VPLLPVAAHPEGWSRPAKKTSAHALYSDGVWRTCRVLGWLNNDGLWYVHIRWPDGKSDRREHYSQYLHPA